MARVPAIATVAAKPWRVIQGAGAITVGAAQSNDPSGLGGTRASVGLTSGAIEWNSNIETTPLMSDQLHNPYNLIVTAWSHQISTNLDQIDLYNLALGMAYPQSAAATSSMVSLDGQLDEPAFKCAQLITEGAKDLASSSQVTQYVDFWKVKIVATGPIVYDREGKASIPITIYGLANSSDVVGELLISATVASPSYE